VIPDSSPVAGRAGPALVGAVAVHLLLTGAHAVAHLSIPVPIPAWQAGYVAVAPIGADGAELFVSTAVLSTASDVLLVVTGGTVAWTHRQGSSATPPTESRT